jgi:hypothetical protein
MYSNNSYTLDELRQSIHETITFIEVSEVSHPLPSYSYFL